MAAAVTLLLACGFACIFWRRGRQPAGMVPGRPGGPRARKAWRHRPAIEARLEAAMRLLGARGIILWAADAAGRHLHIHASSGYPPSFLQTVGPIPLEARLLTAVAYVEGRARTRRRKGWHLAAMAQPVVHDGRLLGVLTAEMPAELGDTVTAETEWLVRLLALQMGPGLAAELPPSQTPTSHTAPRPAASQASPLTGERAAEWGVNGMPDEPDAGRTRGAAAGGD